MAFNPNEHPHQRYNALNGQWVLISPHRTLRPWDGQMETPSAETTPRYDPKNPLCPGNTRTSGIVTPEYKSTFVFTNDFPALMEDTPIPPNENDPIFQTKEARGTCRVLCYHPYSDVYLTSMTLNDIEMVIDEWKRQMVELGAKFTWVQIMENRGQMMGCSNPHPHGQIWASTFLPQEPSQEDFNLLKYYQTHKKPMLIDYVQKELVKKERIIFEGDEWVVLIPYWAFWPFETLVIPKKATQRMTDITEQQKTSLAKVLQVLVAKYDNLFKCNFPYSMGWHGAPTGVDAKKDSPEWTLHAHYYPPLLRSSTVKKFKAAYELLAQDQRDLSPETAAKFLREQPEVRFSASV